REHRLRRCVPRADAPRLRAQRRAAADREWRAGAAPRRAAARLQAREVRDARRARRELRPYRGRRGRLLGRPRLPVVRRNLIAFFTRRGLSPRFTNRKTAPFGGASKPAENLRLSNADTSLACVVTATDARGDARFRGITSGAVPMRRLAGLVLVAVAGWL